MRLLLAIVLLSAGMASAGPEDSLRPVGRVDAGLALDASGAILRPPGDAVALTAANPAQGPAVSRRPELRPRKIQRAARDRERLRERGAVCGDIDIQGETLGRIKGSKRGCGLEDAVRVRSVADVELSQRSVMDCGTAKALKSWVQSTAKPALAGKGGGLKRLRIAAHYACRTRNNQPGGSISEHGRGRAIDISGVRLEDGSLITVLNGWKGAETGPILRQLHGGACGPFGTVLGPDADRFHRDHFHFDTARYRNGTYCR